MAKTTQTWEINGQVYTHPQLMELKKQGLDPRKDEIVMKLLSPKRDDEVPQTELVNEEVSKETLEDVTQLPETEEALEETEEQEFARLKASKAWNKPETRERYRELKKKLNK
jgi:DNA polymerase II large subunit